MKHLRGAIGRRRLRAAVKDVVDKVPPCHRPADGQLFDQSLVRRAGQTRRFKVTGAFRRVDSALTVPCNVKL
jgi:hypothetical protein